MQMEKSAAGSRRALLWFSFPAVALVAVVAFAFGTSQMKSEAPIVDRAVRADRVVVSGMSTSESLRPSAAAVALVYHSHSK